MTAPVVSGQCQYSTWHQCSEAIQTVRTTFGRYCYSVFLGWCQYSIFYSCNEVFRIFSDKVNSRSMPLMLSDSSNTESIQIFLVSIAGNDYPRSKQVTPQVLSDTSNTGSYSCASSEQAQGVAVMATCRHNLRDAIFGRNLSKIRSSWKFSDILTGTCTCPKIECHAIERPRKRPRKDCPRPEPNTETWNVRKETLSTAPEARMMEKYPGKPEFARQCPTFWRKFWMYTLFRIIEEIRFFITVVADVLFLFLLFLQILTCYLG